MNAVPVEHAVAPCEHLRAAPDDVSPLGEGCSDCLAADASWVRLRMCLTCGQVGCCDESPGRHAAAHSRASGHPVVRSAEPGEQWTWCFVDQISGGPRDHAFGAERLSQLSLFQDLSSADLDALLAGARVVFYASGQQVFARGDPGDALYLVLDGELEVILPGGDRDDVTAAIRSVGDFIGEMALLESAPRSGTVRAVRDSRLLRIDEGTFFALLARSPSATRAVVAAQSNRLRSTLNQLQSQQKLALLGQLSAGLIHDLNNPSAAIQRSASLLRESEEQVERTAFNVAAAGVTVTAIEQVQRILQSRSVPTGARDPLLEADQEDAVQDWLEECGVASAWQLAAPLVQVGWTLELLSQLPDVVGAEALPAVAGWLAARASAATLIDEMGTAARAISEVVRAVKDYSYLDQAPVLEVDIHRGIENSLVLLKHKLGDGIHLVREYDANLPKVEGYGSQLSQVWMNLLDNALDALDGNGEIHIRTATEGEKVVVEICDDGPGVPPEIQSRIFDAFFTTKPQGVGSGQGLNTSYDVIVHRHHGTLDLRSRPGETCFTVKLPARMARTV